MLRYDLYRSVHKFIRKKLYQFGEELGKTDFRKIAAVIGIKDSFNKTYAMRKKNGTLC
ncbi:hypothetical protein [Candidatus Tisiphia endosymbiont of Dascillus cervinus]|uniref:hypothetical protein n=1 Tax=Candidatus Tisiphia endosymbiont of Dascillus cervinus TaxID=3066253 RepID=UPI00312C7336